MSAVSTHAQHVDKLYREHGSWLRSWLSRQKWTVHSSEDIAADVFVSLMTMPCVASLREPRAMMTTIARRVIFDARRRKKLQISYEDALAAMPEATHVSPEDHLIIIEALRRIDTVLAGLSTKARKAFLMSQVDGLSNKDIASELGCSVSAVGKYMTQGFAALYLSRSQED